MTEALARYTEIVAEKYREKLGEEVTPASLENSGLEPHRADTIRDMYKRHWIRTGKRKVTCTMPVYKYAALKTGLLE